MRELSRYSLRDDLEGEGERLFQAGEVKAVDTIDHIEIRMFGAFRAGSVGFPSRTKCGVAKKAATLAERLALGMDALVGRETLAWSCGFIPSLIAPATTCTRRYRACGRLWDRRRMASRACSSK